MNVEDTLQPAIAPTTPATAAPAWTLRTRTGLDIFVPPSLTSLSTYVLLEQEGWFEPEMSLLPRLLKPGMSALDIGANHGVYALEIARCMGGGPVWAFEPTSAPRQRLQQSVVANGMSGRVMVVAAALAEYDGETYFSVHDNSELNSRDGQGGQRERVQLKTLDGFLAEHAPGISIDFVKLDAEGDEVRVLAGGRHFFATQSPVVMFEFKNGRLLNSELLQAWAALGFELFRWSAELELLLPFDVLHDETAFALNLFALRPDTQARLAQQGLLASADELAAVDAQASEPDLQALRAWLARPGVSGHGAGLPGAATAVVSSVSAAPDALDAADTTAALHMEALAAVASAHFEPGLGAATRARKVMGARAALLHACQAGQPLRPETGALLVHCLLALGQQRTAVELAREVLANWPADESVLDAMPLPLAPPQRADLERERSTSPASWLRQVLGEFVALRSSFSSYFTTPEPQRWAALLDHPDHAAEIERRYLLVHMLRDRPAAVDGLSRLPDPQHTCNPRLWQGVMQSMRLMRGAGVRAEGPALCAGAACKFESRLSAAA